MSSFKSSIKKRRDIAPDYYSYVQEHTVFYSLNLDIPSVQWITICLKLVYLVIHVKMLSIIYLNVYTAHIVTTVQTIIHNVNINANLLLNGCSDLNASVNETILDLVQLYIKKTQRFS